MKSGAAIVARGALALNTLPLFVVALLVLLPTEALAHGVASGDKGYIQSIAAWAA